MSEQTDGLHITYAAGTIRAFQPNGAEIKGIKSAHVTLNENGMSEAVLYFGIKTLSLNGVQRSADGVRAG